MPRAFGRWHPVCLRLSRWSKAGVIKRVFARLQQEQISALRIEAGGLDSTSVRMQPDGTGERKERAASYRPITRGSRGQTLCGRRV